MKKSASGNQVPRKGSADSKGERTQAAIKPLSKTLSKSHDNLASQLRRKAAAASMAGNKENMKDRFTLPTPAFKTPRTPVTPIRKAQSAHNIGDSDSPLSRTQSAQNIARSGPSKSATALGGIKPITGTVKRASSTQNVSNKATTRRIQSSPPAKAMAYNAELLANFEKEKKALERKISEHIQVAEGRKTELEKLKFELKNVIEDREHLAQENRALRAKLKDFGLSLQQHLENNVTDSEKLQTLYLRVTGGKEDYRTGTASVDTGQHRGGATAAAAAVRDGSEGGLEFCAPLAESEPALSQGDSCVTPEHPSSFSLDNNWDKHSSKSSDAMSEVSLACLQDRILQMEETHYSTNEELEATRLELADLQDTVNELTDENEGLADEKQVLLESLCAQTEKLENCRMQIEHLKSLLVSDSANGSHADNEKLALLSLLRNAQIEKEELLLRQGELSNSQHVLETETRELQDVVTALRDKILILESKNDNLQADMHSLDNQNSELKEQVTKEHLEMQRFRTLLEHERQKVSELEQERNLTEKSDLEELLDNMRLEKERLEERLANVTEELAVNESHIAKLQETIDGLEDEVNVCKKNGKTQVSDLQYRIEQNETDKVELQQEVDALRDHIDQLQADCDHYLEEKKTYTTKLGKLETELRNIKFRNMELEVESKELRSRFIEEKEEWHQFQTDLQMAVKIANNFKTEAQEDMEKTIADCAFYKERCQTLEEESSALHDELSKLKQQQQEGDAIRNDLRGKVISSVDRELAVLRHGRKLSDPWGGNASSSSVKHLIHTIEEQVKHKSPLSPGIPLSPRFTSPECSVSSPRRSSVDSISSIKSEVTPPSKRNTVPTETTPSLKSVLRRQSDGKERSPLGHRHTISNIILDKSPLADAGKKAGSPSSSKAGAEVDTGSGKKGILANKSTKRKTSLG